MEESVLPQTDTAPPAAEPCEPDQSAGAAAPAPAPAAAETATTGQEPAGPPPDLSLELEKERAKAAENYDRLLRTAAELDNLRKRIARVRLEAREEALRDVLLAIAPVLDNLNRALAQQSADAAALRQGVELIRTQLLDALRSYGLTPIEAVGEPFDPSVHEAMLELDSAEHPPGTVIEQTETGYLLNQRLVRPARVIVSKSRQ